MGGIRQLISQITIIYATLMGYCIAGQVKTMMRSVMCKSNLRIGKNILMGILMITCEMFLRNHLMSARIIALIDSSRGRFDSLGDSI